ncbi:MAG TPA: AMP-binding protein [Polyangiaceae bacterium]|nr:AMP-binding protein [Polyangiaceae bacterium]
MSQLSTVRGSCELPLLDMTIGQYFEQVCRSHPHRPALVSCHQDVRWTYAELGQRVDAFAAGLLALGLNKGERVGIWAPNCWEWLVTQYATAKAGLILVTINPAYRMSELEYALNKVGCKALVVVPQHKSSDYLDILCRLAPELASATPGRLSTSRLPALRALITLGEKHYPGCLRFEDVPGLATPEHYQLLEAISSTLACDEPVNIQFTSGTTGAPKGATLSHRNILNNGRFVGDAIGLRPDDRLCTPVPLYHCFGMVMANLGCLTHAACVVYPSAAFDALALLRAVETEKCSALFGVPTMFISVLEHPEFARFDLHTLRTGIMAGSPCPVELMRQVIERMHMHEVTIAYGMTETSPVSFQSNTGDSIERRVTTVGQVQPHLEVKIVDDSGDIVTRGTPGQLCTKGYAVMLGYWEDADTTKQVLRDGWMHTGDLATLDEQGYCNIVGRIKDMVIRGGENIYPREIEEFLYRHPAIQDVQIVGVPDLRFGEELCACIITRPGCSISAEDVRSFCAGQIAHFKIPRYVRVVDAFPTTVSGKVQKFMLRQTAAAELGLVDETTA